MRRISPLFVFAALGSAASCALGQTISVSCPKFFDDRHQAIACTEALFSQDNYHFTLASLPPSNGFGPGLVLVKNISGVTQHNREYLFDMSLTGAITTNGSWFTGGEIDWVPALPYKADTSVPDGLTLGPLHTTSRMRIQVAPWHRSVKTLYYYGEGSASPNTQYVFTQDDTAFDLAAQFPLTRWLTATGESEVRSTTLPRDSSANAVAINLPVSATPGIQDQPLYLHNALGAQTAWTPRAGGVFHELPDQNDPHFQPLLLFSFNNAATFHWEHPADGSPYAYRWFEFGGDEHMDLHQVIRNHFSVPRHPVLDYICEGNKARGECDFGQFDLRLRLVLTQTSTGNQVPFYLEPTLGGTDIDSRVTLRGWDNYRFRGPDLDLLQFEYGMPVYDPLGVFVLYDAGTVGSTASDLTLSRLRQDAGVGLFVRLRGQMIAQTYLAWGAGHGANWGYNFAKVF